MDDEFSAADIQLSFPLEAAVSRAVSNASRPKLMDYLQLDSRAARPYRRALRARWAVRLRLSACVWRILRRFN